jgi:hypothetical protein
LKIEDCPPAAEIFGDAARAACRSFLFKIERVPLFDVRCWTFDVRCSLVSFIDQTGRFSGQRLG